MTKQGFVIVFLLLFNSASFSQGTGNTDSTTRTGWIIYYLGHAIWFESDLIQNPNEKSFFTSDTIHRNGLIVDYLDDAKLSKLIANCYPIKLLTYIDSFKKKIDYIFEDTICIIPAKAKIKLMPATEQFDEAAVSFKRKNNEVTMIYWSATNYFVVDIELLHKKDKRKLSRYLKRNPLE